MKKFISTILLTLAFYMHSTVLIEDIRIDGLQRVSLGSVLDTVPVTIGDKINETDYQRIIRTLFSSKVEILSIIFIKVSQRASNFNFAL